MYVCVKIVTLDFLSSKENCLFKVHGCRRLGKRSQIEETNFDFIKFESLSVQFLSTKWKITH